MNYHSKVYQSTTVCNCKFIIHCCDIYVYGIDEQPIIIIIIIIQNNKKGQFIILTISGG